MWTHFFAREPAGNTITALMHALQDESMHKKLLELVFSTVTHFYICLLYLQLTTWNMYFNLGLLNWLTCWWTAPGHIAAPQWRTPQKGPHLRGTATVSSGLCPAEMVLQSEGVRSQHTEQERWKIRHQNMKSKVPHSLCCKVKTEAIKAINLIADN